MADKALQAQMAMLAALSPESFIEMAVQQNFRPEDLAKAEGMPPLKLPGMQATNTAQPPPADPRPTFEDAMRGFLPMPPQPAPAPPPVQGPPPPNAIPAMGNPGEIDPRVLLGLQPQAPQIPGAPPVGALPPAPGAVNSLVAPNAATGMPVPPSPIPQVALPNKMPDVLEMGAGALGGLAAQAFPPDPLAGPPGPPIAGGAPPVAQAMGNPGEVGAKAAAAAAALQPPPALGPGLTPPGLPLAPGQVAPPPQAGIWEWLTGPVDPNLPLTGLTSALAGVPQPPAPPGPNVSQFDLMAAPPPTPPPAPPVSAGLKPVSSAGVTTTSASKPAMSSGSPNKDATESKKSDFDALAAVGSGMANRGGGAGGKPGSAGVVRGQIQQGELMELLAKLMQPASYTPGAIPYGKLFG